MPSFSAVAFYVDPGSGSMVLQLLLGGLGGVYVVLRLFKQRLKRLLGIRSAPPPPVELPARNIADDETPLKRSA